MNKLIPLKRDLYGMGNQEICMTLINNYIWFSVFISHSEDLTNLLERILFIELYFSSQM